jgi:hypothetical protein
MHEEPKLTASQAVMFGHATVTLPVVAIMIGVGAGVYVLTGQISSFGGSEPNWIWRSGRIVISVIVAEIPGWVWWTRGVRRWRNWTERRGVASDSLEKLAVRTLLVWRNRRFENQAHRP